MKYIIDWIIAALMLVILVMDKTSPDNKTLVKPATIEYRYIKCPVCHGVGKTKVIVGRKNDYSPAEYDYKDCNECGGKGYVKAVYDFKYN